MNKEYAAKLQKWSFIVAIIGFISLGLGLIALLFSTITTKSIFPLIIGIIVYIIPFIIMLKLFNGSKKLKEAIEGNDVNQELLNEAINEYGNYFKISGIVTIVFTIIAVLLMLIMGNVFMSMLSGLGGM